jgi:hypothetical protein
MEGATCVALVVKRKIPAVGNLKGRNYNGMAGIGRE